MSNRTIKHEIKLQKSVIVILGAIAVGVCAHAFAPAFSVKDALAQLSYGDRLNVALSGSVRCYGCN